MDLSKLSDEELAKLAEGDATPDVSKLSDAELEKLAGSAQPGTPGTVKSAARGIAQGATLGFADELAGVGDKIGTWLAGQTSGLDPKELERFQKEQVDTAYKRGRDEYRADDATARAANPKSFITGEVGGGLLTAVVPGMGVARGSSLGSAVARTAAAGAAGGLGSSEADLTGGDVGGAAVDTAVGGLLGGAIPLAGAGISAAARSAPVQKAAGFLGNAARKTLAATTGIDDNIIKTYLEKTKKVDSLIKSYGKEGLDDLADKTKEQWRQNVAMARQRLNGKLAEAVDAATPDQGFSVAKARDSLLAAKEKLNPRYNKADIADIDSFLEALPASNAPISGADMHEAKQFLQEQASGSYSQGKGLLFTVGDKAQRAAKTAAAVIRQDINAALPEYAEANMKLSKLHAIEQGMNKNLLASNKPINSIVSAGSGANTRNARTLKALGDFTGTNILGDAQEIAAAKAFADPGYSALYSTGKAALGAGVGYGVDGQRGAVLGAAASNPALLRKALQAYSATAGGARAITPAAESAVRALLAPGVVGSVAGQESDKLKEMVDLIRRKYGIQE